MANKWLVALFLGLLSFEATSIYIKETKPRPTIQVVEKTVKVPVITKTQDVWYTEAVVTAYCPCKKCCGAYTDGKTSTGQDATKKGVAVDPNVIPYGSEVIVITEDNSFFSLIADDTGSAMKEATKNGKVHIDLRFGTHQEALEWGRQFRPVIIYQRPE